LVALSAFAQAGTKILDTPNAVAMSYTVTESITMPSVTGGPIVIPSTGYSNVISWLAGSYNLIAANHSKGIILALFPSGASNAALTGPTNIPASDLLVVVDGGANSVCNLPDTDNVNSGVGDLCFYSTLVSQTAVNSSPTGVIAAGGFDVALTAPITQAGSWNGTMNLLVYAP